MTGQQGTAPAMAGRAASALQGRRYTVLDHTFFVVGGASAIWLAYVLARASFSWGWGQLLFLVLFWALVAYLVLPRIHRILTQIYVPAYFIGRTRTSDGLLGDPVNLAFRGSEDRLRAAMARAGWTLADQLTFATGLKIVTSTLRRQSYLEAPVSPLLLFGRQQDFAFQQEVDGSPGKRHHIRFWRCPDGWLLPGGIPVDWLAAGTYDRSVGLSLFTLQITHKIEADIDVERDYVLATLAAGPEPVSVEVIRDFSTGYHSRNGGGDQIATDGDLPIVDVGGVRAPAAEPAAASPKRPPSTVAGTLFLLAGALEGALVALALLVDPADFATEGTEPAEALWVAAAFGLLTVLELGLAAAVFAGRRWARTLAMALTTLTILTQAAQTMWGDPVTPFEVNVVGLTLDILLLLALSSDRSRLFANRRTPTR
ncbi:LssY C-terminal domain-containing protein [Arthrobacter sp. 35W]|uniref:LssY C-terminal domain-containing protein n=1 Tax=Arthrobacter sp. 35W TaxID=1132441 RepID=UPI0004022A2E|nr:LssY C-terminal domain-containing protein [Arthrobacter sp. 35W]